jgi:hypothetical protein
MGLLTANDVITAWELGRRLHPLERAIALLALAYPDQSQQQLALLSVGQRDRRLLALREMILGSRLHSVALCPDCGDRLEFGLNLADICVSELSDAPSEMQTVHLEGVECQFRLPNSHDLALITAAQTAEEAGCILIEQCILQVSQGGDPVDWQALPAETMARLTEHIGDGDPQAEVLLNLVCPACGHTWQAVFDIVSFFWAELEALAQRLLQEVHTLAKAYGWREADILAMSATRRQLYLDLVA